jgi:hypothetical protein
MPTGCGASGAYAPGPDDEEEETSILWAVTLSVLVKEKSSYEHVSNAKWLTRYIFNAFQCLMLNTFLMLSIPLL